MGVIYVCILNEVNMFEKWKERRRLREKESQTTFLVYNKRTPNEYTQCQKCGYKMHFKNAWREESKCPNCRRICLSIKDVN